MGLAYLAKVGIPSIRSAIVSGPGEHKYRSFEQDANLRAFKYFNKNVEGFYESFSNYKPNDGKGWDFIRNPLVPKSNPIKYIDYQDKDMMKRLEQTLSIKAMLYHYIPIIPGFFEKLKGNY